MTGNNYILTYIQDINLDSAPLGRAGFATRDLYLR